MRNVVLGIGFGAGLVVAVSAWWNSVDSALAAPGAASNGTGPNGAGPSYVAGQELLTYSSSVDEHRDQLTVIDPRSRVVSIYHVARDSGEITLKSVRNIHWDLQMEEFNCASPRPREIRVALEQK